MVSAIFATTGYAHEATNQAEFVARGSVEQPASVTLSAAQLFKLADEARARHDFATAETVYRALAKDRDLELRTEARFRLGMMLADDLKRYSDAAIEFRRILDDKPDVGRVRLELARMQAVLGDLGAARRELRAAEAAGLPQEVEQLVRFYSRALDARKPLGGSIKVALAPDSNINRATRSDTLGTVIGDFILDEAAQAKSGIGLDLQGQGYIRLGIEPGADLLVRASGSALLYRAADFNDVNVGIQAGPQYVWGGNQLTFSFGPSWRWYGRKPYSRTIGGNVSWRRPTGKRSQVRIDGGIAHQTNKRNPLQTADNFTLSASFDRAFSARTGGGLQIYGFREAARDPGYSLASGGASIYLFRELGRATVIGTLGYGHLEADARLFLYPERRVEDRYNASLAVTLRALRLGGFAPLVRLNWERNRSSIEIYDYRRVAAEFGVTSAF
ncbi:surface lipoprotein assembly modifier [Sphingopyxis sp.]|uniref:surface lipoprotein assembly modifier n=1 Tax=Sphingopyxis sp. TaxID=1908224 RepID=UPI002D796C17|nr:surface lipoprotein assembly modifier [Sphingopyxis sp.]HET6526143.1 surface lipoprotein assembly modifier [Sphingopyxis sp.]